MKYDASENNDQHNVFVSLTKEYDLPMLARRQGVGRTSICSIWSGTSVSMRPTAFEKPCILWAVLLHTEVFVKYIAIVGTFQCFCCCYIT